MTAGAESPAAAPAGAAPAALGRRNLVAGIVGYGWASALQLVATPLLLAMLGPESFGLIGFYMAVLGVSKIFDLGLSPTINREVARAAVEGRPEFAHDLLRTVERGYWVIGVLFGLVLAALAPVLAGRWVATSGLAEGALRRDVALIGLLVAVQWPIALYEAGLIGLQRLTTMHLVGTVMRTAGVAAGLLLLYVGPRALWAYLLALAAGSLLHVLVLARALWRALPPAARPARWDPGLVRRVWRFAAGMTVLMLLGAVVTHADKLLLSRLLSLRDFGYYTLATLVSSGLHVLVLPIFYSMLPVLAGRVAAGDERGEHAVYHLGAQSLAVLVVPAAAVIALFAGEILVVWTGSAETARHATPIVTLLVLGTALNGLTNAPSALQLAHGRTQVGIALHLGLIPLFVPAIVVATATYGARGAAAAWIGLQALYLTSGVLLTHRFMLRGEAWAWLRDDVLAPSAVGTAVAVVGRMLLARLALPPLAAVAGALLTLALAWLAAALAAPRVRHWLLPAWAARRAHARG